MHDLARVRSLDPLDALTLTQPKLLGVSRQPAVQLSSDKEIAPASAGLSITSGSVERFAGVAEAFPAKLTAEREALIQQLSSELLTQQQAMRPMLAELRATLEAGDATAASVEGLIQSIERLMARLPANSTHGQAPQQGVDIQQYTAAAAELGRTAQKLQRLVGSIDAQAPALASSLDTAISRIDSLVDRLFWRLAALLVLLVSAVMFAALPWRKMTRARPAIATD